MVNFLKKRLQVFVSSTYIDLIEERRAAVEAILNAGHIPAGMELFAAGDESQMQVIKQWIDESDVYLLILGGRYGSIEPKSEKSYIHLEYEYALSKGIALFSCVLQDPDARATQLGDIKKYLERENPKQYNDFRKLVESEKIVKYWSDFKDIKLAIMQTLQNFSRRDDLLGWVRGDQQVNLAEITTEITRLSEENARLREQLSQSKVETFAGLSYEEMKEMLENTPIIMPTEIALNIDTQIHNLFDYFLLLSNSDIYRMKRKLSLPNPSKLDKSSNLLRLSNFGLIDLSIFTDAFDTFSEFVDGFCFTDDSRRFLNKLELEKSRESQNND